MGCTGDAIKQRKIIYFDDIKQQPGFENVIDNSQGKYLVQSLLIAPIYDSDEKLKGVVQLVNKEGKITEKDVYEIGLLMPTLGEIFRTIEKVRISRKVSSCVNEQLNSMKDSIYN